MKHANLLKNWAAADTQQRAVAASFDREQVNMTNMRVWYCECNKANGTGRRRCHRCGSARPEECSIFVVDVGELFSDRPAVADTESDPELLIAGQSMIA